MKPVERTYLPPEEMERRRKMVAQGRRHFIVWNIMLRWGLGAFALMAVWSWFDNHGWSLVPFEAMRGDLLEGALSLAACAGVSYLYGTWAWRQLEDSVRTSGK
jgi:hypothetical protein